MNMAPPPESLVGKQIGQFLIKEEIGRGGMATVYRAQQQSIGRDVALKVLPPAFLHDPDFYERFTREVDVVANLEHPHIVPIYDFGKAEGTPYIAMRLLAGGSLRSLITEGSPELHDLIKPVQQLAEGLDYAHQQGIIHRDIKPGNMLLDAAGNAYLSDFGIARVLNSDLTGSAIIGTPAYMSPEQAQGESVDARADIYSLGVVIFELITGREPFSAETPIAMILKHLNERVPYLSEFRNDIPHEVDKVIAKATEKRKDQRYSSAGALAQAFGDAVRGTATTVSIPTDDRLREEIQREPKRVPLEDTEPILNVGKPKVTPTDKLDAATITPAQGTPVTRQDVVKSTGGNSTIYGTDHPSKVSGSGGKRSLFRIGLIGVVIVVVGVLLYGALVRNRSGSSALPIATPFAASQTVQTDIYAINIPQDWIPPENTGAAYYDIAEAGDSSQLLHAWQDANAELLVTLAITDRNGSTPTNLFANYIDEHYTQRPGFQAIDNETFPDGSMRYSYRITGFLDFPAGQMDVFLLPYDARLVAIEMYAADSKGNTPVPIFQKILESFQLRL